MPPEAAILRCLNREQRAAVECLLVSFDQQWRPDRLRASVAELREIDDAARYPAFVELIKIDIERHWQSGKEVTVENYLHGYPELRRQEAPADLIHAEYIARRQRYPETRIEEYAGRFPAQFSQVKQLVALEAFGPDSNVSLPSEVEREAAVLETRSTSELSTSESSFPLTLGRYRLVGRLGKGGMGEVFRAVDARLGRDVAVKILAEKLADDRQWRSRFECEAQTVAALSHPNILAIHDFGWEGRTLYVVTELLEGETLRQSVATGATDWRDAFSIGLEVAKGLSAAHEQGIVHRDVKPENVFLTNDGRVKVLDFGLARNETPIETVAVEDDRSARDDPLKTAAGTLIGTIAYMAPEQVRGEAATPQSDLFALGGTLYEMLSGRRPFSGQETMAAILGDTPASLGELVPGLPAAAAAIVHRCLEKDAAGRYTTASELADALSGVLRETAPTPTFWMRSRRTFVVAACGVLIVMMFWLGRGYLDTLRSIESLAVLPLASSGDTGTALVNNMLTDGLRNRLSRIAGLRVITGSRTNQYQGEGIVPSEVGRELGVDGVVAGSLRHDGEHYVVQLELVDARHDEQRWGESRPLNQESIADLTVDLARKIAQQLGLHLEAGEEQRIFKPLTKNREALNEYNRGRYAWQRTYGENPQDVEEAIDYYKKAIQLDESFSAAYAGLANCYNIQGAFEAIPQHVAYERGYKAAEKAVQLDPNLSEAHSAMAGIYMRFTYDWERAEHHFKRAIELNANNDVAWKWYSSMLAQLGRREAIEMVHQVALLEGVSVNNHFQTGWVLYLLGDYQDAVEQLEPVAHQLEPNSVVAHIHLGLAYIGTEQWDAALGEFHRIRELVYGDDADYDAGPLLLGLVGHVFAKKGEHEEAREILSQLTIHSKQQHVSPLPFGEILLALGDVDEAISYFERAIEGRVWQMGLLKQDAVFRDLRAHPRYDDLLGRVNLQ